MKQKLDNNKHIVKLLIFDMFVIEFGPVGVFFLAYYLSDFPTAALALGLSTFLALVLSRAVNKRTPWFAIFSGTVTMATSLATYLYDSPTILIVKDSVYYFLFASILAFSAWRHQHVFRAFFGHVFAITEVGWGILERRWMMFFLTVGTANEITRMFLSVEEWVIYKQVVVILFVIFGLYQFRVSTHHRSEDADEHGLRKLATQK